MYFIPAKKYLRAVLLIGFIGLPIPLRSYENLVGPRPELSLLVYLFGLSLGFATMLAAFSLETRAQEKCMPAALKRSGIAVLAAALLLVVTLAVCTGIFLADYQPEKPNYSSIAYLAGLLISFAAVGIISYLPNYLPQEKKSGEECPSSTRSLP